MPDFKTKQNNPDEYIYDIIFDKELIEQSLAKQYHVLPSEQGNLSYSDWAKLVSGLMDDTPLGRVVAIRTETNKDIIKGFNVAQNEIRRNWNKFKAKKKSRDVATKSKENLKKQMDILEKMIANLFGKGGN